MIDALTNKQAQGYVKPLEDIFKNLPHLPKGLVDFLVSITPWLAGLAGILSILGGLSSVSGQQRVNRFMSNLIGISNTYWLLSGIISIIVGVLLLLAFSHLRNKKIEGWMLLFWADILGVIHSVLAIVYLNSSLVGTIISVLIGFYILFEIKPAYKKGVVK